MADSISEYRDGHGLLANAAGGGSGAWTGQAAPEDVFVIRSLSRQAPQGAAGRILRDLCFQHLLQDEVGVRPSKQATRFDAAYLVCVMPGRIATR